MFLNIFLFLVIPCKLCFYTSGIESVLNICVSVPVLVPMNSKHLYGVTILMNSSALSTYSPPQHPYCRLIQPDVLTSRLDVPVLISSSDSIHRFDHVQIMNWPSVKSGE